MEAASDLAGGDLASFLRCFAVLIVPTTLSGAHLPARRAHLRHAPRAARRRRGARVRRQHVRSDPRRARRRSGRAATAGPAERAHPRSRRSIVLMGMALLILRTRDSAARGARTALSHRRGGGRDGLRRGRAAGRSAAEHSRAGRARGALLRGRPRELGRRRPHEGRATSRSSSTATARPARSGRTRSTCGYSATCPRCLHPDPLRRAGGRFRRRHHDRLPGAAPAGTPGRGGTLARRSGAGPCTGRIRNHDALQRFQGEPHPRRRAELPALHGSVCTT